MTRKFEIRPPEPQAWLAYLQKIAEFCEEVGTAADLAGRPLPLHLIIYPTDAIRTSRLPKLPMN